MGQNMAQHEAVEATGFFNILCRRTAKASKIVLEGEEGVHQLFRQAASGSEVGGIVVLEEVFVGKRIYRLTRACGGVGFKL